MYKDNNSKWNDNYNQQLNNHDVHTLEGIFPIPLYRAHSKPNLSPTESAELEDIIKGRNTSQKEVTAGQTSSNYNSQTNNSFAHNKSVFETKFANLKEYCENHIKIYVKEVFGNHDKGLTFYITQSWVNITKPGETHGLHWHMNSIISGVFYISVQEGDHISFFDPFYKLKNIILIDHEEIQAWNSDMYRINVTNNELILFPSWLDHGITQNESATTDRISLAFNVFVKGSIGTKGQLNELVLR